MSDRARKYNVLNILLNFHAFPGEVDGKYCLVECTVPVDAGALNFVPVPGHWGTLPLSVKGAPNGTTATEVHRRL